MQHRTAGRQRFERPAHPQRPQGDQSALLVAATRRGPAVLCDPSDAKWIAAMPQPVSRAVASHLTDDRLADREIGFADIPDEDPNLLTADPQPAEAPRGVEPLPLREGHEHADSVLAALTAETPTLEPRSAGEHTVHHQLPKAWLRSVSPLSALDVDQRIAYMADAALDIEIELVHLAAAVSDLGTYVDPASRAQVGKVALKTLRRAVAAALEPMPFPTDAAAMMLAWNLEAEQDAAERARVGDRDGRPVVARVGYDLESVVAA